MAVAEAHSQAGDTVGHRCPQAQKLITSCSIFLRVCVCVSVNFDNSHALFFFGADSCWMMDEAVSSCFPLMFGLCIIPQLSVVVLGGFCSNPMCFSHTVMKDSLLVLAQHQG